MRIISAITEEPISYSETWVDGYGWYPLKKTQVWVEEYGRFFSSKDGFPLLNTHRVQWWQTLNSHLVLEKVLMILFHCPERINLPKSVYLVYDMLFGLVTGRPMREIISFWSDR
jgi:hypothetical protein